MLYAMLHEQSDWVEAAIAERGFGCAAVVLLGAPLVRGACANKCLHVNACSEKLRLHGRFKGAMDSKLPYIRCWPPILPSIASSRFLTHV